MRISFGASAAIAAGAKPAIAHMIAKKRRGKAMTGSCSIWLSDVMEAGFLLRGQ
jgi:hypothetical protein